MVKKTVMLPFSCISFSHNPEFRTSHRAVLWNYYLNPKVWLNLKNLTTKIYYCGRALRATVSQQLRCTINTARAALLTQSSSHTVATRGCQKISTSKFKTILEQNWQNLKLSHFSKRPLVKIKRDWGRIKTLPLCKYNGGARLKLKLARG